MSALIPATFRYGIPNGNRPVVYNPTILAAGFSFSAGHCSVPQIWPFARIWTPSSSENFAHLPLKMRNNALRYLCYRANANILRTLPYESQPTNYRAPVYQAYQNRQPSVNGGHPRGEELRREAGPTQRRLSGHAGRSLGRHPSGRSSCRWSFPARQAAFG